MSVRFVVYQIFCKMVLNISYKTVDKKYHGLYNNHNREGGFGMELTKSEMQIMDVLWASDAPLSRSDILDHSDGKTWKDSSVHILLNGLLAKDVIREAGFVKRSKTYGRTFAPTLTREEYFATTIFCHTYKPEMIGLMEALLRREDITPDVLVRIKQLIEEKLEKL